MITCSKGRAPKRNATPKTVDSQIYTKIDPLIDEFNLVMQSRNRQQSTAGKGGR